MFDYNNSVSPRATRPPSLAPVGCGQNGVVITIIIIIIILVIVIILVVIVIVIVIVIIIIALIGCGQNGVAANGAAAKVMSFDGLGKKVRPGTLRGQKQVNGSTQKVPLSKELKFAVTPLVSADPFRPLPK